MHYSWPVNFSCKISRQRRYIYSPEPINGIVQEGRRGGRSNNHMIVIQNLVRIDKELAEPVYQQLANGIVSLIRQGHLKPGMALPSSRKLAETFEIHRKTVV